MKYWLDLLRTPFLAILTIFSCVVVHESGHVVAGYITGGAVKEFRVLSLRPHVKIDGPKTARKTAWRALAGSGTVLITWLCGMILLPLIRAPWIVVEAASFFSSIEILGWLLSCLVHPLYPQNNDAGKFLAHSGMEPSFTFVMCLALTAALGCVFWHSYKRARRAREA